MSGSKISSVELSSFFLLSPGGQPVLRTHDQLSSEIRKSLGDDHATLFAEPVISEQSQRIDWYGPGGKAERLVDLSDIDRVAAEKRLYHLYDDLVDHSTKLKTSSDPDQQRLGRFLEHATQIPSKESIYVVNGQPVLTNWGGVPSGQETNLHVLRTMAHEFKALHNVNSERGNETLQNQEESLVDSPIRSRRYWPAVALSTFVALTLLAIGNLLLGHCGLALPTFVTGGKQVLFMNYCEDSNAAHSALQRFAKSLQTEISEKKKSSEPSTETQKIIRDSGGVQGQLNVSLKWRSYDDLDLSILCPNGKTISWQDPENCGGKLQIDMNFNKNYNNPAVEDIVWKLPPPSGNFTILVVRISTKNNNKTQVTDKEPTEFEVEVNYNNRIIKRFRSSISTSKSTAKPPLSVYKNSFIIP